jgi:hypothetical protein
MNLSDVQVADACVAMYERELAKGHCHCLSPASGVNASLDRAMALQTPATTLVNSDFGTSGGLAVLLRGGAFRGAPEDDATSRRDAQAMCSRSLVTRLAHPLRRRGTRVRFFLTVYDNMNSTMVDLLSSPYSAKVAAITRLSSRASEQLTATANALKAFLEHCRTQRESFDAVVVTRFDLYFKVDLAALLGDLRSFSGVHFLWRELELGTRWRLIWSPGKAARDAAPPGQRAAWDRVGNQMAWTRNHTMLPSKWRRSTRTADVFHAFSFPFTRCYYMAVLVEMTRGWSPKDVMNHSLTPGSRGPKQVASSDHYDVGNHWLHKMRFHMHRAVQGRTGYLLDNSTYDSNPCAANCMQNPVYEILPRGGWLVRSGICQDPADFIWDPTSQTYCCPSPDYCCPNSIVDCADPRAVLFDAHAARAGQGVPRDVIQTDWRRHFLSRMKAPWSKKGRADALRAASQKLAQRVCSADQWSDGRSGTEGCFLAMTNASAELVAEAWRTAPAWVGPWPEDDDNVHMRSHSSGAGGMREASKVVQ